MGLMYLVIVSVTVLMGVIKIAAMPNLNTMTPGAAFGAVIYFFIFVLKFAIVGAIYLYQRKEDSSPTAFAFSQMPAERTSEMPRSGKGPWGGLRSSGHSEASEPKQLSTGCIGVCDSGSLFLSGRVPRVCRESRDLFCACHHSLSKAP